MKHLIFLFSLLFIAPSANSMTVFDSLQLAFLGHPYQGSNWSPKIRKTSNLIKDALQANILSGVVDSTKYPGEEWQLDLPSYDDLSSLRERIKKSDDPQRVVLQNFTPSTRVTFAELIGLAMLAQECTLPRTITINGLYREEPMCSLQYRGEIRWLEGDIDSEYLAILDKDFQIIAS